MFIVDVVRVGVEVYAKGDCFDILYLAPDPSAVFTSLLSVHSPLGDVLSDTLTANNGAHIQTEIIPNRIEKTAWVHLTIKTDDSYLPLKEITDDMDLKHEAVKLAACLDYPDITPRTFVVRTIGGAKYLTLPMKKPYACAFVLKLAGLLSSFQLIVKTGMIASKKDTLTVSLSDQDGKIIYANKIKDVRYLLVDPDIAYHASSKNIQNSERT